MLRKLHCFCRLFSKDKLTDLFARENLNPDSLQREKLNRIQNKPMAYSTTSVWFNLTPYFSFQVFVATSACPNVFDKGILWTSVDFVVFCSASPRQDRLTDHIVYACYAIPFTVIWLKSNQICCRRTAVRFSLAYSRQRAAGLVHMS